MNRRSISEQVEQVREVIRRSIEESPLGALAADFRGCTNGGKLLRSRFLLRLGGATGVPLATQLQAAAAVELVHVASLLHDDVVDHGQLRRGKPTLWVEKGVKGAILLGDFLVCRAIAIFTEISGGGLARSMAAAAEEMCGAEVEQELLLQDKAPDWNVCLSIARRKTGSLFALAGEVAAGPSTTLREVLREAGYAVGTAYQLADDMLDAFGDPLLSDKTLGGDEAGRKITAASAAAFSGGDPAECIRKMCATARDSLSGWPKVRDAWDVYLSEDIGPVMDAFLEPSQTARAG